LVRISWEKPVKPKCRRPEYAPGLSADIDPVYPGGARSKFGMKSLDQGEGFEPFPLIFGVGVSWLIVRPSEPNTEVAEEPAEPEV
jgi:hypothetical protein